MWLSALGAAFAVLHGTHFQEPPPGVRWISGAYSKTTGLWIDGHFSDRHPQSPRGEKAKRSVAEHGQMDRLGRVHLPDGRVAQAVDGHLPGVPLEPAPSYEPPPKKGEKTKRTSTHHRELRWEPGHWTKSGRWVPGRMITVWVKG